MQARKPRLPNKAGGKVPRKSSLGGEKEKPATERHWLIEIFGRGSTGLQQFGNRVALVENVHRSTRPVSESDRGIDSHGMVQGC